MSWALTLQNSSTTEAMRLAVAETGNSGRVLLQTLDTTKLTHLERKALADHKAALSSVLSRSQQLSSYSKYLGATATALLLLLGSHAGPEGLNRGETLTEPPPAPK